MPAAIERTDTIDRRLAMRADKKLRRYGADLNGFLASVIAMRGSPFGKPIAFPARRAVVPSVIEFDVQGKHFVADITPDEDRYFAQVRGCPGCFTEGGNEEELRKYLEEVTELVVFDMGEPVHDAKEGNRP